LWCFNASALPAASPPPPIGITTTPTSASYGADEVRAQIDASEAGGGSGFMLWDPTLDYQFEALVNLRAIPAGWQVTDEELVEMLRFPDPKS
jgi:hypothetical protein